MKEWGRGWGMKEGVGVGVGREVWGGRMKEWGRGVGDEGVGEGVGG